MKRIDHTEILLRYLEGRLAPDEARALESKLEASASMRDELQQLKATRQLLHEEVAGRPEGLLKPFFTDRLMKQLRPQAALTPLSLDEELALSLSHWFRPVALIGLLLVLVLAAYNVNLASGYQGDTTVAESVLALPPVSTEAVYYLDNFTP